MADEIESTCSLCDAPLDTTGYPLWCKKCRTEKKRALKQQHEAMANGKGFAAGAEAMRQKIMDGFGALHPAAVMSAHQARAWVQDVPVPRST